MNEDMDTRLLTTREVAAILRVSQPTVRALIEAGELDAIRPGTSFRIFEASVADYLQRPARTIPPT